MTYKVISKVILEFLLLAAVRSPYYTSIMVHFGSITFLDLFEIDWTPLSQL